MRKANIFTGTELLLKALAYQDKNEQAFWDYKHPEILVRRHEIKGKNKLNAAISRILSNLMDQVIKEK